MTLLLIRECPRFTPTTWLRAVAVGDRQIVVDVHVEVPGADPVGVKVAIDLDSRVMPPDRTGSLFTLSYPQVLLVAHGGRWWTAACREKCVPLEVEEALVSCHGLDPLQELHAVLCREVETLLGL